MSRVQRLWLCIAVMCVQVGCKDLLGIEERSLDVSEISEAGYDGCRPATNLCTSCTSKWHTCICEGWNGKPEIELRNDCAEEAPEAIRADVEDAAEERYSTYISDLEEDGYDGCKPKRGDCDECLNEWHECLCEDWQSTPLPELRAECAELSPEPVRDRVEEDAEEELLDFLEDQAKETDAVATDAAETDVATTDAEPTDVAATDPPANINDLRIFNESFCDSKPGDDDCLGCFCGECAPEIAECQQEFGCSAIADCFLEEACDPLAESGNMACVGPAFCGDVVNEYSASLPLARSMFGCVQARGCPCGDGMGAPNCNPTDGCNNCPDCWGRCFCEGKSDGQCQEECGSPNCTANNGCLATMCNDCLDQCFCEGLGDRAYCGDYCRPGGVDCAPELGCNCDNCMDECLCDGSTWEACEGVCGGTFGPICDPIDNCAGCTTCGGACYCEEPSLPFSECMLSCEIEGCEPNNCDSCTSCQTRCECEGEAADACLTMCTAVTCEAADLNDCERCACDRCTSLFGECEQYETCIDLMYCFQDTGCIGMNDCDRPELCRAQIDAVGGRDSPLLGVAEALQTCRVTQGCACFSGGVDPNFPPDITCGAQTCVPFVPPPPDPIAEACCLGSDGGSCGIVAGPIFGMQFNQECLPLGGPGIPTTDCPTTKPDFPPYNGDIQLDGCCTASNLCGYVDNTVGLGCVPAEFFGVDPGAQTACNYDVSAAGN